MICFFELDAKVNLVVTLQSVWSPTGSAQTPRSQHANKHNKTMLGVSAFVGVLLVDCPGLLSSTNRLSHA